MEQRLLNAAVADGAETCSEDIHCRAWAASHTHTHQQGQIENVLSVLARFEELTKEINSSIATDIISAITTLKRLLERRADRGEGTAKTTVGDDLESDRIGRSDS